MVPVWVGGGGATPLSRSRIIPNTKAILKSAIQSDVTPMFLALFGFPGHAPINSEHPQSWHAKRGNSSRMLQTRDMNCIPHSIIILGAGKSGNLPRGEDSSFPEGHPMGWNFDVASALSPTGVVRASSEGEWGLDVQ